MVIRGTMERIYSDFIDGFTFTVFGCKSEGYLSDGKIGFGSSEAGVNGYSSGLNQRSSFNNKAYISLRFFTTYKVMPKHV